MANDEAEHRTSPTPAKVSNLGRYRLIAELARGGMGVVYLALVRGPGGFNKLFVVKELKSHLAEHPALVAMFLDEARLAAKLSHPNVVQTMEVGSDGPRHYIAMEYLDGQSFNRALARSRKGGEKFPLAYFLYIVSRMLEGLAYAHEAVDFDGVPLRLVHRDVSPHNVFVTYDGQVKVLDFGIAKALGTSNDTGTGILKGKVAYMAPEQASGTQLDGRADVFSAGVMLFEGATATRMWGTEMNDLQILHALMRGEVPKPRNVAPEIDADLESIVLKATAADRDARYASAAAMQADVDAWARSHEASAVTPRDLGKYFSDVFSAERVRIKQVVDKQVRTLRGMASGEFEAVDLPRLTVSSAPSATPSGVLTVGSGSRPGLVVMAPTPSASIEMSVGATPPPATVPSPYVSVFVEPALEPPSKKPALFFVLAAVGALVLGGLALLAFHGSAAPAAAASSAGPAISPSTGSGPPAPASSSHVLVTVSPAEATISLDGLPPIKGALSLSIARDSSAHSIRAEAPLYEAKTITFAADADHTFDLSLDRVKATAGAPPSPWRPVARPSATSAPPPPPVETTAAAPTAARPTATAQSPHTRQQIDTHDPYAP